jgi:hypothetical protein
MMARKQVRPKEEKWWEKMVLETQRLIRDGKSLGPIFFMQVDNAIRILPLGEIFVNKDEAATFLRLLVQKVDPDEYLLLMESWLKRYHAKDEGERGIAKLVESGVLEVNQLPSKQECLFVVYGDRNSEKSGFMLFERNGGKTQFQPIKWDTGMSVVGRFCNLRGK